MKTIELLETRIYPNLDIETLLDNLEARYKKSYYTLRCPQCGKKEAYIPNRGSLKPIIICNRKNKCGYISSIWNYFKSFHSMSNRDILHLFAHHSNISLESYSYSSQKSIKQKKSIIKIDIAQKLLLIEDVKPLPPTTFSHIITDIYNFSLKTNQEEKIAYYKKRGIMQGYEIIGFLSKYNYLKLERTLLQKYSLELLQKYNLFKNEHFKYNFSSFCVIPSYDLFSDKLSAVRFRNIYPSKIKEIEISNKRELNPLPFGITLKKLKKYGTFYFTEGHIDALSLGVENFVAVEGVSSFSPYNLGLFIGKKIIFAFDNDKAGIEGVNRLNIYAKKLGIKTEKLAWDACYGKDINELLCRSHLDKISVIQLV